MLPDQSQGNPLQMDPRLLMQMMMARRAQAGAIPGAAAPAPAPQAPQAASPQAAPQGGMPGAAAPPPQAPSQAQSQPLSGPARQLSPASPTPFNGTFGDRRGIISQIVDSAEKKSHDKKVNEASMYYNQINSFLASNDPGDQAKAHQLLDDPKIRKILKTGLDYVPLEETPPPEAIGIHQAQQKINQKQSVIGQLKQMLSGGQKQGNAQQSPPGRAAIPQPSQAAQGAYAEQQAKIAEQQALTQQHEATASAEKQKADAETVKAEAERVKNEADVVQAKAYADNARSQAKLYEAQAKNVGDMNLATKREKEGQANALNALARFRDVEAQYLKKGGKMSASALQGQIKSARGDMVSLLRGYISDNKDAAKAVSKDTGYLFGPRSGLIEQQQSASKSAKDLTRALAWFDGEGTNAVTNGKMTLPEAVNKAYKMAGIEAPVPSMGPTDTGDTNSTPGFVMGPDGVLVEQ